MKLTITVRRGDRPAWSCEVKRESDPHLLYGSPEPSWWADWIALGIFALATVALVWIRGMGR